MKRKAGKLIVLLLASLAIVLDASAQTVITAMETDFHPAHLEKSSSYARILAYDGQKDTLTVELTAPEIFSREEARNLKPGDRIYSGGREIIIRTLEKNDEYGYILINEGPYQHADGLSLHEDRWGNYRPERYGNPVWITLDIIECPVQDSLLFLDYISVDTGDALSLPLVRGADDVREMMIAQPQTVVDMIGLDIDNAYVIFDGEGNLAVIQRHFVSWQ